MEKISKNKEFWTVEDSPEAHLYSSNGHCCLCFIAVFGSLIGIVVMAIGVCSLLNYIEFNPRTLPNNWLNMNNAMVVGLAIFCSGLVTLTVGMTVGCLVLVLEKPGIIEYVSDNDFRYVRLPTEDDSGMGSEKNVSQSE